jgi:hypothetical protein
LFPAAVYLGFKKQVNDAIDEINVGDGINSKLFDAYSSNFTSAVNSRLSGDKYAAKRAELLLNVNKFAAYKSYHATQEIARERADKHGEVRSDKEYRKAAKKAANKYNRNQITEHNVTVSRARTAKQWIDFNSDPERVSLYPNMKWLPSRSAEPRLSHQQYYGLVLPKNDPFWNENQPGNLWNCKCDWEETDEPAADRPKSTTKPAEGLEGNPGETGEVFTANHTYFNASNKIHKHLDDLFFEDSGVQLSVIADKTEIADNLATGIILKKIFKDIEIKIRPHVYRISKKNPEFLINGKIGDAKRLRKYSGVTNNFRKAVSQQNCKVVILDFNKHWDTSKPINVDIVAGLLLRRKNDFRNGVECYLVYGKKAVFINSDNLIKHKLIKLINGIMPS